MKTSRLLAYGLMFTPLLAVPVTVVLLLPIYNFANTTNPIAMAYLNFADAWTHIVPYLFLAWPLLIGAGIYILRKTPKA